MIDINIHPVDELAGIREEIKQLQEREAEIRAGLLEFDADLQGRQYAAAILVTKRETLDKEALIADLGRDRIAKYLKTSEVRQVRLSPQKEK